MQAHQALACLSAARQAASGGAGWPGWEFDAHPVALVVAEGTLLWGHPAPPAGFRPWVSPSGADDRAVPPGPLHVGPPRADLANSVHELGGRIAATVRLEDGSDALAAQRLILHEGFHAFQQAVRPGSGVPFGRTPHYPEDDAANNALARAENTALAGYVAGGAPAADCAADVVVLRRARYGCLAAEWRDYEAACEWCEGGATLAEACGYPEPARGDIVAGLRQCSRGGEGAAVRRFYHTGAALGLLCSELLPGWQARWMAPGATPFALVEQWAAEAPGAARVLVDVLRRFGVAELLAEETLATAARRAEDARILAGLVPAVEIDTSRVPPRGFMYDPSRLRVLGGGRRLHRGLVRQEGPGWVLEVGGTGGPVLEDLAAGRLVLRAPAGLRCAEGTGPLDLPFLRAERAEVRADGDGWRIMLHRGA